MSVIKDSLYILLILEESGVWTTKPGRMIQHNYPLMVAWHEDALNREVCGCSQFL